MNIALIFTIIITSIITIGLLTLILISSKYLWKFDVKDQMRHLLDDTIKHYSLQFNRAISRSPSGELNGCFYLSDDLKKCAVGRKMKVTPKSSGTMGACFMPHIERIYNKITLEFWRALQSLHDSDRNWNKYHNGLSEQGRTAVDEIKIRFGL